MKKAIFKELLDAMSDDSSKSLKKYVDEFSDIILKEDEITDDSLVLIAGKESIGVFLDGIDDETWNGLTELKNKYNFMINVSEGGGSTSIYLTVREFGHETSYKCPECGEKIHHSHLSGNYYCRHHGRMEVKNGRVRTEVTVVQ